MKKLKKIAKKANKFKYALEEEQKKRKLKVLVLKQEVPMRYTAAQTMAKSFLHMGKHSEDVDDEEEMQAILVLLLLHVTKTVKCRYLGNREWYHRSAGKQILNIRKIKKTDRFVKKVPKRGPIVEQ